MEKMKQYIDKMPQAICYWSSLFEGIISIMVLMAVVVEMIKLIEEFNIFSAEGFHSFEINSVLGSILWLVIGLEFIKMLMEHSHAAVLEVLLFAVARQMIVEHTSMLENLIAVVAIAGVFLIRKFLYVKEEDKEPIFKRAFLKSKEKEDEGIENS